MNSRLAISLNLIRNRSFMTDYDKETFRTNELHDKFNIPRCTKMDIRRQTQLALDIIRQPLHLETINYTNDIKEREHGIYYRDFKECQILRE